MLPGWLNVTAPGPQRMSFGPGVAGAAATRGGRDDERLEQLGKLAESAESREDPEEVRAGGLGKAAPTPNASAAAGGIAAN